MDAIAISANPRPLGATSLRVFPLAYGGWRFAGSELRHARAKIETALDIGINLFDHADIYGGNGAAEELFGRVLAEAPRDADAVLVADLDLEARTEWLRLFPFYVTRRPDLYAELVAPVDEDRHAFGARDAIDAAIGVAATDAGPEARA